MSLLVRNLDALRRFFWCLHISLVVQDGLTYICAVGRLLARVLLVLFHVTAPSRLVQTGKPKQKLLSLLSPSLEFTQQLLSPSLLGQDKSQG